MLHDKRWRPRLHAHHEHVLLNSLKAVGRARKRPQEAAAHGSHLLSQTRLSARPNCSACSCVPTFQLSLVHVDYRFKCWCVVGAQPPSSHQYELVCAVSGADTSNVKDGDWVAVLQPESLPKGVRKEVQVDGNGVLLFWYRNQIFAIAARSPAEGAYSEGFIKAKFTQDYGIICPTTNSVFSLKNGSVIDWYPSNPVLRAITPTPPTLPVRAAPPGL